MTSRRAFIVTAVSSIAALPHQTVAEPKEPWKAPERVPKLHAKLDEDHSLLLLTDAPASPSRLVKEEALLKRFSADILATLKQPDHWYMIAKGLFFGDDTYVPSPSGDDAQYWIWAEYYRPEVEAYDFLLSKFEFQGIPHFGIRNSDLRLTLAEHPSTPRFATARLDHIMYLPRLERALDCQIPMFGEDLS